MESTSTFTYLFPYYHYLQLLPICEHLRPIGLRSQFHLLLKKLIYFNAKYYIVAHSILVLLIINHHWCVLIIIIKFLMLLLLQYYNLYCYHCSNSFYVVVVVAVAVNVARRCSPCMLQSHFLACRCRCLYQRNIFWNGKALLTENLKCLNCKAFVFFLTVSQCLILCEEVFNAFNRFLVPYMPVWVVCTHHKAIIA